MYNHRDCTVVGSGGAEKNSIDRLTAHVVTRGVLIDLLRHAGRDWLEPDHEITVSEIESTLKAERVLVGTGDILLIRTGQMKRIRQAASLVGYTHSNEPGLGLAALP